MKPRTGLRQLAAALLALGLVSPAGLGLAQQVGGLPETNLRVDAVEARVTAVEGRTGALETTVADHTTHLADHEMRLQFIETPSSVTVSVGGYAAGNAATVNTGTGQAAAANARTDRWQTNSPNNTNIHRLNPKEVNIQQNGSVNFVISGLHPLGVYPACADETVVNPNDGCVSPAELLAVSDVVADPHNAANLFKINGVVRNPATIDYDPAPGLRLYRGLDNQLLSLVGVSGTQGTQVAGTITVPEPAGTATTVTVNIPTVGLRERTEVVFFPNPGRYLVVCLLRSHLADGMFGYINVAAPAN